MSVDVGMVGVVLRTSVRTGLLYATDESSVVVVNDDGVVVLAALDRERVEVSHAIDGIRSGRYFVHLDTWGRRTTGDLPLSGDNRGVNASWYWDGLRIQD